MKLTKQDLVNIIKEELTKQGFTYAADRIANALHGAGASGDESEIQQYIAQILNRPDNPPRMPGKFSNKVGGHQAVANAVRELFRQAPGEPDRNQIADLANEIAQGIRSRLSESEHSGRAKSVLGLEEAKMKLTKQELMNIIKEEIEAVVNEQMSDQMDPDLMNKILEIVGEDGFVNVEDVQKQLSMERERGGQDLDPDDSEVAEHIEELVEDGILSGPDADGDFEEGDNFVKGKAYEVY